MVCVNMSLKRKYVVMHAATIRAIKLSSPEALSSPSSPTGLIPFLGTGLRSPALCCINGPKEGHKKGSSPATMVFMFSSAMSIAEDFRQNLLMSQTGFEIKI